MTTYELTREELDELKEAYFQQLKDTDPEVLEDITYWQELPDSLIHEHYDGFEFVREDFECNHFPTCEDF